MSTLSILLPPCSPDYSGVASVLYELGGMVVLHDASGCTGNYLGYDEPRWIDTRSLVYCSGLRHIDAVLGRDDKLVSRVVAAAESFHPAFIAIIGSPVPMLVGTDYQGIAREIEAKTGIPSFGFDTTGLDFYDKGVVMATKELLKRFAPRTNHYQQIPHTINIVGATPLDWGNNGNITACRSFFAQNGIQVTCCLSMSCTLDDIKQAPTTALNVAVSEAGIQIAEFMENEYHIPYVVGIPLGDGSRMLQKVQACLGGKQPASGSSPNVPASARRILIVGEQVLSCSLREEIQQRWGIPCTVAVLFNHRKELLQPGDFPFVTEKDLRAIFSHEEFTDVFGDPLLAQLDQGKTIRFHSVPTIALSSKYHEDQIRHFLGDDGEALLREAVS
jgi:hypothetical protein